MKNKINSYIIDTYTDISSLQKELAELTQAGIVCDSINCLEPPIGHTYEWNSDICSFILTNMKPVYLSVCIDDDREPPFAYVTYDRKELEDYLICLKSYHENKEQFEKELQIEKKILEEQKGGI